MPLAGSADGWDPIASGGKGWEKPRESRSDALRRRPCDGTSVDVGLRIADTPANRVVDGGENVDRFGGGNGGNSTPRAHNSCSCRCRGEVGRDG